MNFSMPQGSVQGAFLFIAYASTIQEVVKEDLTLTGFVDDHSICKQFKSGTRLLPSWVKGLLHRTPHLGTSANLLYELSQ